jgi:deazaflavin-dependent oxidoreductase (nitroreductase family)
MRYPERMARVNRVVTNPIMRPMARRVPPWAIVHHIGRRSGTAYRSPVVAFSTGDGFVIPLAYGVERDWVRNVLASGSFELERAGRRITVTNPTVRPGDATDGLSPRRARALRAINLPGVLTLQTVSAR